MNAPKSKKTPPTQRVSSLQLDLFQWLLANPGDEVSNTVELWDSIPKYFFTPHMVKKLRTESGHADPYKWGFDFQDKSCEIKIQPALIEQKDGSYKAFFPGATEEVVEEALKKILTDQHSALHNVKELETWVRFTIRAVGRELKEMGKGRSVVQIKHALEVMSSCLLILSVDDKEVWKGAILQDFVTVDRQKYLSDTEAQHVARLPLFISHSINKLDYRQFNYRRLMSCREQLSFWIYKRLINRYKQAAFGNSYHLKLSSLEDSGLLQHGRERDRHAKVVSSLKELTAVKVIRSYEAEPVLEGRRTIDVVYTLHPSMEFVAEQKAANKRETLAMQKASKAGVNLPVDNLL